MNEAKELLIRFLKESVDELYGNDSEDIINLIDDDNYLESIISNEHETRIGNFINNRFMEYSDFLLYPVIKINDKYIAIEKNRNKPISIYFVEPIYEIVSFKKI